MSLNWSSEQWAKIVGACGQCEPAYRQIINSIFERESNEIDATSSILYIPYSIFHIPYSILNPQYSPDLAPSNFYLFESVKRCLAGPSFEDAYQFLAAIEGVLEGIARVMIPLQLHRGIPSIPWSWWRNSAALSHKAERKSLLSRIWNGPIAKYDQTL
jgi:hypothetical protein